MLKESFEHVEMLHKHASPLHLKRKSYTKSIF